MQLDPARSLLSGAADLPIGTYGTRCRADVLGTFEASSATVFPEVRTGRSHIGVFCQGGKVLASAGVTGFVALGNLTHTLATNRAAESGPVEVEGDTLSLETERRIGTGSVLRRFAHGP